MCVYGFVLFFLLSWSSGHIDALTSNLFLHEELSVDDLKRRFGTFKSVNSVQQNSFYKRSVYSSFRNSMSEQAYSFLNV